MKRIGILLLIIIGLVAPVEAAAPPPRLVLPDLPAMMQKKPSAAADVVRRYEADRESLHRTYPILDSRTRHVRMRRFLDGWATALGGVDATKLSKEAQADLTALAGTIDADRRDLGRRVVHRAEAAPLVPFAGTIIGLEESRRRMEPVDSMKVAGVVTALTKQVTAARKSAEATATKEPARRAAETVTRLRGHLKHWFDFYNGYDPVFSWWMAEPFRETDEALQGYAAFLRDKVTREGKVSGLDLAEMATVERPSDDTRDVPDLAALLAAPVSEMQGVIRAYSSERGRGSRLAAAGVPSPGGRSPEQTARQRKAYQGWLEAMGKLDFDRLGH